MSIYLFTLVLNLTQYLQSQIHFLEIIILYVWCINPHSNTFSPHENVKNTRRSEDLVLLALLFELQADKVWFLEPGTQKVFNKCLIQAWMDEFWRHGGEVSKVMSWLHWLYPDPYRTLLSDTIILSSTYWAFMKCQYIYRHHAMGQVLLLLASPFVDRGPERSIHFTEVTQPGNGWTRTWVKFIWCEPESWGMKPLRLLYKSPSAC